jgi:hypothetical protein
MSQDPEADPVSESGNRPPSPSVDARSLSLPADAHSMLIHCLHPRLLQHLLLTLNRHAPRWTMQKKKPKASVGLEKGTAANCRKKTQEKKRQ